MNQPSISNRSRLFEISAVIATAIGKFIFMDYLNWKFPYIIVVILFWIIYVFARKRAMPSIMEYWGFRTDNFKKVMLMILPFGIASSIICIAVGIYSHTLNLTWHILPILLLYPIWGVIQQFLLIALTAGNLQDYKGLNLKKGIIIFLTALLFGLIHYPIPWLMAGTFVLAIFYGIIYFKERNLYSLGIYHGCLGAIFYYTVVGKDPFMETFGTLFHLAK
jgi:membrane protease YdiL (CAAX protease family)